MRKENIKRKSLRDKSNPLNLPDEIFVQHFRLNKEGFTIILNKIGNYWKSTSIPLTIQLAATLRFLAEGSFQRSVGNDLNIAMHRTTVSKCFTKMLKLLERKICPGLIKLKTPEEELKKSKQFFYEKYGIHGVIGCIDGTHVALKGPTGEEHLFFNRKGYYSINAMIICDYKMDIKAVDATRPGSSHDSFIFNMSTARNFFISSYENGERGSWLLADSGYPLEPFVMTPYRNPRTICQQRFNKRHTSARNVVERTIGVLKSRFRCLSRTLWYSPLKTVQIINICCALHNLCNTLKIQHPIEDLEGHLSDEMDGHEIESFETDITLTNSANIIRDNIAESLI
ncbi:putative nuclease HARBI1 [Calliphora vicina]|uniref:putative nuclease HARBI1 n=1 Tax=Calliphora vicina TaxID=7373 RepID=UPI00325ADF3F